MRTISYLNSCHIILILDCISLGLNYDGDQMDGWVAPNVFQHLAPLFFFQGLDCFRLEQGLDWVGIKTIEIFL